MKIEDVLKNNLCLGCGICTYDDSIVEMKYSKSKGMNIPTIPNKTNLEIANQLCPGKGYNIKEEGRVYYGKNNYSIELGFYNGLFAAHSINHEILKKASSGGLMTELLKYLLETNVVDKVAVTKFIYTKNGPSTMTFLTNNIDEILESQGSKYCPVDISNVISEIKRETGKIAYLGTPCQIAGIRQIQKIDPNFKEKIILTIANFCGGFKSYKQINKIAQRHHIKYDEISFLRFRGGGQPGSMAIEDKSGRRFEASYKKYGGFTGYSKLLRCHLCVDATGELADIAFGDAWLEKYEKDPYPWSVILTRTQLSLELINSMKFENKINIEPLTESQVCLSQNQNLKSKKTRQFTRYRFYKKLGYMLPDFDGGFHLNPTSLKTEIEVYFTHRFKELLEILGLYKFFRILIKKEY